MKMTNENQIVHHNKKKQTADPGELSKKNGIGLELFRYICSNTLKRSIRAVFFSPDAALRPKTCMTDGGKHGKRRY